jgi:hypothetical protein
MGRLTVYHEINLKLFQFSNIRGNTPCGGGLEYLHRKRASRKRRQKGDPILRGITGPPCSWGIEIREPGPQSWGSLKWESSAGFGPESGSAEKGQ